VCGRASPLSLSSFETVAGTVRETDVPTVALDQTLAISVTDYSQFLHNYGTRLNANGTVSTF
jgi:hypothetical protein